MDELKAHCQSLHTDLHNAELEIARANRLLEILANAACEVVRVDGTIQKLLPFLHAGDRILGVEVEHRELELHRKILQERSAGSDRDRQLQCHQRFRRIVVDDDRSGAITHPNLLNQV